MEGKRYLIYIYIHVMMIMIMIITIRVQKLATVVEILQVKHISVKKAGI